MKKVLCVLMCVCVVSMANALTVTNGDFEVNAGSNIDNVEQWYDRNTGSFWESAWQSDLAGQTPNGTSAVVLTAYGNAGPDGDLLAGDSYLYQSIGTAAGEASVAVAFDWGHPDDTGAGRHDGLTVSVFASDGSFVGADNADIYGAAGVTLLDSASYDHVALGTDGEIWTQVANLDLSGANVGDELFLRFNSTMQWPSLDNVRIVPEPASMALLGLGALLLRRKR